MSISAFASIFLMPPSPCLSHRNNLVDVHVFDTQSALCIPSTAVEAIAIALIAYEKEICNEVSIHFVDSEAISALHAEFFDDPSTTDCISFPMDDCDEVGYRVLGEVFVCTQTAVEYAARHKKDPYQETTLYIVHGLLHLMGYDDIEEEDRILMRAAEKRNMKKLKKQNLCIKAP